MKTVAQPARLGGLAAAGALLLHGVIAFLVPLPGIFSKYSLAARQHLSGELPTERLMDFSPFYFHLAVLYERLFAHPERALEITQIVLAALVVGLFATLLARRFSPALTLGITTVFAFDRHLLVFERVLEPEVWLLFALLAVVLCLDTHRPTAPLLAGLAAGTALLARPTFLPLFLLTPLYYHQRASEPLRGRQLAKASALFLLPVLAALAFLSVRALVYTGSARTPVMNPGTVFFEGNNPLSHGTSAIYPPVVLNTVRHTVGALPDSAHQHYRTVARAATGEPLGIAEVNAFWLNHALATMKHAPADAAARFLEKTRRIFHSFRWHDISTSWVYDRSLPLPTVPFALLTALALPGVFLEARRLRHAVLFYLLALVPCAVMVLFYVSARQRLALVPAALYFAAVTLEWVGKNRRRGVALALWTVLLMVPLSLPDDAIRDEIRQREGHRETDLVLQEIRRQSADFPLAHHTDLAVDALAASPWWLDWLHPAFFPHHQGSFPQRVAERLQQTLEPGPGGDDFDLAIFELRIGEVESARKRLEELVEAEVEVYRGGRQPSLPGVFLGRALTLEGDTERAREVLEETLRQAPGDAFVLAELVALTDDPGHAETLQTLWSAPDAHYLLGQALLAQERPQQAAHVLGALVERLPDFRDARVLLAAALGEAGAVDAGAEQYLRAMTRSIEPLLAEDSIVDLFRRWSAAHPERFEAQLYAARVLHHHGHFREALDRLESLEAPFERWKEVEEEKVRLRRALEFVPEPEGTMPSP